MTLPKRSQIRPGLRAQIVEKQNQRTGALTEGVVLRLLTKSPSHPPDGDCCDAFKVQSSQALAVDRCQASPASRSTAVNNSAEMKKPASVRRYSIVSLTERICRWSLARNNTPNTPTGRRPSAVALARPSLSSIRSGRYY